MVQILDLGFLFLFFGEIFRVEFKFTREFIEFADSRFFNFFSLAAMGLLEAS